MLNDEPRSALVGMKLLERMRDIREDNKKDNNEASSLNSEKDIWWRACNSGDQEERISISNQVMNINRMNQRFIQNQ